MELEDMKAVWSDLTEQLEQQKKLTDEIILKMTQQQYKSKLYRIVLPETIGSVICFATALLIAINLPKLGGGIMLLCGIISLLLFILLPVLSLRALSRMMNINIGGNSYQQTLIDYAKGKRQFQFAQKLGFYLCFVLMLVFLPVATKLMDGKNIFQETSIWIWYIPLGSIGLYFFTTFVYRYFKRTITEAEALLSELED